ncbi:hypothetical protein NDU88_003455 [Pleurodeles waltl]|uniref:Uncharacterized protein n=1 Tax=Pleurodeles waltl TaxID=8319 RepID=A0AAV7WRQ3_PLEWA|nr:hypothetical protein NDU88_003455 [Pleurodeles waltl]
MFSMKDTTMKKEATEGREFLHAPGGTWLNQSRSWDRVCSRQQELPATSQAKSGTESRFPYPCDECDGVGNPSGRIPEPLHGCQDDVDAIGVTGKFPQEMKREDGLRAARSPEKEDAGGDSR